jgi:hypothetical protein
MATTQILRTTAHLPAAGRSDRRSTARKELLIAGALFLAVLILETALFIAAAPTIAEIGARYVTVT